MAPPPPSSRKLAPAEKGWRKFVPTTWEELQPKVSFDIEFLFNWPK